MDTTASRGSGRGRPAGVTARQLFDWRLTFLLLIAASLSATPEHRYEETRSAMGTQFTIVAYGPDEARLQAAVSPAFAEILRLNRQWSDYNTESEISAVNRRAANRPVQVDSELFTMLETCQRFSKETEGAFDITVGPLLTTWGFFKGAGRLPANEEVVEALGRVGWRKLRLNAKNRTVSFAVPGMRLDLGAIGKGYAIDTAGEALRNAGIKSALLLAGTSSILAVGSAPDGSSWGIDIRDPKDRKKTVEQEALKDASLSTSGNYEKFFRAGGRTYSHIFDPRTGYPVQHVLSTSVIAPTATQTDALSTSFFVMGKQATLCYLTTHPGIRVFFCSDEGCQWLGK